MPGKRKARKKCNFENCARAKVEVKKAVLQTPDSQALTLRVGDESTFAKGGLDFDNSRENVVNNRERDLKDS